jgi:hypothetical protein
MMLTVDEYMALRRLIDSEKESEGAKLSQTEEPKKRRSRSARKSDSKLSKAFKEANQRLRKKNGNLRSGKTQADVARLAQRLRRKM